MSGSEQRERLLCPRCSGLLRAGLTAYEENADGGPPALTTPFECDSCERTCKRYVLRPCPAPGTEPTERTVWVGAGPVAD